MKMNWPMILGTTIALAFWFLMFYASTSGAHTPWYNIEDDTTYEYCLAMSGHKYHHKARVKRFCKAYERCRENALMTRIDCVMEQIK